MNDDGRIIKLDWDLLINGVPVFQPISRKRNHGHLSKKARKKKKKRRKMATASKRRNRR